MLWLFEYKTLILSVLLFVIVYIFFQYKFLYWKKKNVPGPAPVFPYGNLESVIKRKDQFFQPYCDNYFKFKQLPYVGMYSFTEPVLSIHDPDVAKRILITDFDHFQAHGIYSGGDTDLVAGHLFNKHGKQWKVLRSKLMPAFSLAKLKTMFPLIEDISNQALSYVESFYSKNKPINFSDFYEKYTMEVIGNVGFGVICDGFNNSKSEFYLRGHEYFTPKNIYRVMARTIAFFAPKLFKILNLRRVSPATTNFFFNLVKETAEFRQKSDYKRNDYLQALVELKNETTKENQTLENFTFTMSDLAANTMLYMFAGYETSATIGQYAAYLLASNPDIQNKARAEIRQVLRNYKGECTYEAQNEMTYMNMILDETMRIYPPMRALFRRCTKDYKLDNLTVDKGTLIFVPIQAIQMDPDIFPDPEVFDPERFAPEKKKKLHPCVWMPFGEGPRKCMGVRQGYVQTKMGLLKILQKYELLLDDRTEIPLRIKVSALANAVKGGVWIRLKELNSS